MTTGFFVRGVNDWVLNDGVGHRGGPDSKRARSGLAVEFGLWFRRRPKLQASGPGSKQDYRVNLARNPPRQHATRAGWR